MDGGAGAVTRERSIDRAMEFAVRAWSAQARLGSLQLAAGLQHLETPSLLILTRKGLPAFIPPDLFDSLHPDARACQVSPLHLYAFLLPSSLLNQLSLMPIFKPHITTQLAVEQVMSCNRIRNLLQQLCNAGLIGDSEES